MRSNLKRRIKRMNAEEFTRLVANLGRPGEPEEEAAALQRLIHMARKVKPEPQPDLEMLRTAVRLLDRAYDGTVEDTMTDDEILDARAAARGNVFLFISLADPMGPEAADLGLSQEIAGTEVEGPRMTVKEWLDNRGQGMGSGEEIEFCDFLLGVIQSAEEDEEGWTEEDTLRHLFDVADEFISTAQAFKKHFGS
jgi:hypothetical protein